jgi:hypothetical protein
MNRRRTLGSQVKAYEKRCFNGYLHGVVVTVRSFMVAKEHGWKGII